MHRRHLLSAAMAAGVIPFLACGAPAFAAPSVAEDFIASNTQAGFAILNDASLDVAARRTRFATFLLGLVDVRRVALFLAGPAGASAAPADREAYVAAYQDYILAVYQSYFAKYAGQTLRVVSSRERAKDDVIVRCQVAGAGQPVIVEFRVRTDGAKPVVVDLGVEGVWLAVAQRDEFASVLAHNGNDMNALSAHLRHAKKLYG